MLFDRFICPARSVSQFWLLEDGWSCVTGLRFTNNRAEVSHVDFYLESFRILGYFRWTYDRLGSQEALQQLKAAGFEVRTIVGWNQIWFGGCFQKHEQHGCVSKFPVPLHGIRWLSSNVNPVFETSPFPRIQSTKFFPFWLHHTPMCNVPSFMRWLLGLEAASQAQKAGRVSEKPWKKWEFFESFSLISPISPFQFFQCHGCWWMLVYVGPQKEVMNWILQRCAATWATFVQDFWPDVTWLSWKFDEIWTFLVALREGPCLTECPWLWLQVFQL